MKSIKSSFKVIFSFIFFFVLTISANAGPAGEDDGVSSIKSLSIKCTYGAFVVGYTDATGEVYATAENAAWEVDHSSITLSDFQNMDGSYSCKDPLYYSTGVSGRTAVYTLSFNSKNAYGIKYKLSSDLTDEDIQVPDDGGTTPPETYKICTYGANGSITISYNNKDVKTNVANLGSSTLLTDYDVSSFANGCPEQVYTFGGGGYYKVSILKFDAYNEVKRKDLIDAATYLEMCSYNLDANDETKKISIYTNGEGDYYIKSSLDCYQLNMDYSEVEYGCFETIYYKTEVENGKNVCYFTFDKSKGYSNSATYGGSGFYGGDPLNCDDFITTDGVNIISDIFNIIMIIGPILALVLGGVDFAKATLQSDENALKKAGTNFGKRIIAAILLFLLPLIINLVLSLAFNAGIFGTMKEVPSVCLTQK